MEELLPTCWEAMGPEHLGTGLPRVTQRVSVSTQSQSSSHSLYLTEYPYKSVKLSGGLRTTKKEDMINRIIAAACNRPKYSRLIAEEYNSSSCDGDNKGDQNSKKKQKK
jgi:hypothetical protein